MVRGKHIWTDEWVEGYYVYLDEDEDEPDSIYVADGKHHYYSVDLATVEPLALRVITQRAASPEVVECRVWSHFCPNCGVLLAQEEDGKKFIYELLAIRYFRETPNYCSTCGQRLAWDTESEED
jgi:hypothetical protein